jgi:hypothetical protein
MGVKIILFFLVCFDITETRSAGREDAEGIWGSGAEISV